MTFFPEEDEWLLCGKWMSRGVPELGQDQFLPSEDAFIPCSVTMTRLPLWDGFLLNPASEKHWEDSKKGKLGIFTFVCSIILFPITMDGLRLLPAPFVHLSTIFASSSAYSLVVDITRVRLPAFWRAGAKSLSEGNGYYRIMAELDQFT